MDKIKDSLIVIIIFVLLLLGSFLAGRYTKEPVKEIQTKLVEKRDTTYIIKQRDSTVVKQAPADVYYYIDTLHLKDTIFLSKAFIARLDTIIKKDTIYTAFYFPQQKFDFSIRYKPDSTVFIKDSIYSEKTIIEKDPWWMTGIKIGCGTLFGYGLRSIK